MKTINLICDTCKKHFERPMYTYRANQKVGQNHFYCCRQCQPKPTKPLHTCQECANLTSNAKYCSRTCATKAIGKKTKESGIRCKGKCKLCKKKISSQRTYCEQCYKEQGFKKDYDKMTLEDCKKRGSNLYHAVIRVHARKRAQVFGLLDKCRVCNYSIFVECCHIKSIASYPINTLISVVNDITNLVGLCPNHHAEFDKGLLKL